jgi:hypothetical protein
MYRGTLPISMDAPSGQAGDVLEEVLEYVSHSAKQQSNNAMLTAQMLLPLKLRLLCSSDSSLLTYVASSSNDNAGSTPAMLSA